MKKLFSRLTVVMACTLAITAVTFKPATITNMGTTVALPNSATIYGLPSVSAPIIYR